MKLFSFIFVASVAMYPLVILVIGPSAPNIPSGLKIGLETCAAAVAVAMAVVVVRFVLIAKIMVPDTPGPAAEWLGQLRGYFLVSHVLCERLAILAFILRFLGAALAEAAPVDFG